MDREVYINYNNIIVLLVVSIAGMYYGAITKIPHVITPNFDIPGFVVNIGIVAVFIAIVVVAITIFGLAGMCGCAGRM
jgi:NO-binding membrane sensor protein with MHYT domain